MYIYIYWNICTYVYIYCVCLLFYDSNMSTYLNTYLNTYTYTYTYYVYIYIMIDWLLDWLIDWMIDGLIAFLAVTPDGNQENPMHRPFTEQRVGEWIHMRLEHLATLRHGSTTPPADLQAFASVVPAPPILHEVPSICVVSSRVVYCS